MRDLFEITKIIFEKPHEWKDITIGEKKKYFFIINRMFAIQFPMQANALQNNKINQVGVMDFWQDFMRKRYQRTPNWMFTKGVAKTKEIKEKKSNIPETLINEYSKRMSVDKKSIIDALHFYPDLMTAELRKWQKSIETK